MHLENNDQKKRLFAWCSSPEASAAPRFQGGCLSLPVSCHFKVRLIQTLLSFLLNLFPAHTALLEKTGGLQSSEDNDNDILASHSQRIAFLLIYLFVLRQMS